MKSKSMAEAGTGGKTDHAKPALNSRFCAILIK
jgi:hypothetical protein